ncbi:MAG: pirin family protein [Patescibacteria group bacterium]
MKTLYPAESRGKGDYGWLKTRYSFSFGNYYNPERLGFGALQVINDDRVEAGTGFDFHSHDNMEIITIPLSGALLHKDTMGNSKTVSTGEVQVMSAGSGVTHSEWNASSSEAVELLQIWVATSVRDVAPHYDQMGLDENMNNTWQNIVSPYPGNGGLWIHQNAWFSRGRFDAGSKGNYTLKNPNHGVYLFVIQGQVSVGGQVLHARDAMEITGEDHIELIPQTASDILLIEVPL